MEKSIGGMAFKLESPGLPFSCSLLEIFSIQGGQHHQTRCMMLRRNKASDTLWSKIEAPLFLWESMFRFPRAQRCARRGVACGVVRWGECQMSFVLLN